MELTRGELFVDTATVKSKDACKQAISYRKFYRHLYIFWYRYCGFKIANSKGKNENSFVVYRNNSHHDFYWCCS